MPFSINYHLKYHRHKPPIEAPLYLRIIYNRRYYSKSMRRLILVSKWDERKERVRNTENSVKLNLYLDKIKRKTENSLLELDEEYDVIPPQLIKKALKRDSNATSFLNFFQSQLSFLESTSKIGTFKKDRVVYNKLNKFLKGKDLLFVEINEDFLGNFEVFIKEKYGNGQNTIHNNLRVLRKLFYEGIRRGFKVKSQDVFRNYKLKKGRSKEIVFLIEQELDEIWDLQLSHNHLLETCRDMFVFACDVGGMRISDVLLLKKSNLVNGRVTFNSRKTDITVSIKINSRPKIIIEKYADINLSSNDFVFPALRGVDVSTPSRMYSLLNSKTAIVNKNLKMIAVLARIDKNISFHVSRHTFGMRAITIGISLKYVSELMGHSNILMTEKYLDIQNSELDNAMDRFNNY